MVTLMLGPSVLALGAIAILALKARLPGPVAYPTLYLAASNGRRTGEEVRGE